MKTALCAASSLLLAQAAFAAQVALPVGGTALLASCGGSIQLSQDNAGQLALVVAGVRSCSNLDVSSITRGYLDPQSRGQKLGDMGAGFRGGVFPIAPVYLIPGSNDVRVELSSDSGKHQDVIDLVLGAAPSDPDMQGTSLAGYCADLDHSQFMRAKEFAYGSNGLNLTDAGATQWALSYNSGHACGTIGEFSARYGALYEFAYSSNYLNYTSAAARQFALERVETLPAAVVLKWKPLFDGVREFAYSSNYLNYTSARSVQIAKSWVLERGKAVCGGRKVIEAMEATYTREYNFAYSSSGLNLTSAAARAYALGRIQPLTPCADLLN